MTTYDPGDVVLVRFPFTDQATSKKRPALVLSPTDYSKRYGDVVLLALTSKQQSPGELAVEHWKQAGLPKPSWFKPLLGTVTADLVVRRVGTLDAEDRRSALTAIKLLIADEFQP